MRNYESAQDTPGGRVDGVPAPTKGLNTQSPLEGLSPDFAVVLDNWVCQPDAIVTRTGALNHVTGFAAAPKTLMQYSAGAVSQMFAANSAGIFNVSTAGTVGASVTALTNGQGKSVNIATSAGQFLYFVNGRDNAKLYDGTAWTTVTATSTPAVTGLATTQFFDVEVYRSRLYFLANNILGFYYLPADSVGGAANLFRVGALCRLGGRVVGHGTWSIDGGSGPDDHYVVATSNGEIIVWRGNDPAVAANWTYIGTYYVGKPFNQNCFVKYGGDLLFLCENGLVALSSVLQSASVSFQSTFSAKIQPTISKAVALFGGFSGWKIHVIPRLSLVLINSPSNEANTAKIQFVYNSYSKGWSTFSNWNAADFIEFEGSTYFTKDNTVAKAFEGTSDFGADIVAICDTSYNRFKTRSQLQPLMVRALFASTGQVSYTLGIAQDFSGSYAENLYGVNSGVAGLWGSALWDVGLWGGTFTLRKDWVTVTASGGLALSTRFKVASKFSTTLLLAVDYKFANQGLIS